VLTHTAHRNIQLHKQIFSASVVLEFHWGKTELYYYHIVWHGPQGKPCWDGGGVNLIQPHGAQAETFWKRSLYQLPEVYWRMGPERTGFATSGSLKTESVLQTNFKEHMFSMKINLLSHCTEARERELVPSHLHVHTAAFPSPP